MPKLICYNGSQYTVPDWAKYVMHDSTGWIYVYSELPKAGLGGVWQPNGGLRERIGNVNPINTKPMVV